MIVPEDQAMTVQLPSPAAAQADSPANNATASNNDCGSLDKKDQNSETNKNQSN